MTALVRPEVDTVNMDRRPTVRRPTTALVPESPIARAVAPAGRSAADPQNAARGRLEPAFLGKAFERRPIGGI